MKVKFVSSRHICDLISTKEIVHVKHLNALPSLRFRGKLHNYHVYTSMRWTQKITTVDAKKQQQLHTSGDRYTNLQSFR